MLTQEENDLLTQTGPGTPCGTFLRSYWQPAALSEELPPGGPPIPLKLFGEELVMFRDEQGRIGLLDLHCSHRGTDLSYGRLEDGGLRCIYHGWLYDVHGKCLETPNEPAGSHFHEYVRHPAYPCQEVGGVIFTYMGTGEPPLLPNYEVLHSPPEKTFTTKHFHECNYLQGLEGNMDNTHVRFLHRIFRTAPGNKQLDEHPRDLSDRVERNTYFRDPPPEMYFGPARVEETEFSVWDHNHDGTAGPDLVLPSLCMTGGGPQAGGDGYQLYWRVPVDDTHHWLFVLAFRRSGPMADEFRHNRSWALMTPDYRFIRNKANRYLQDREEQRTTNFTGMGTVFIVQDAVANESQGLIQNRSREMLGVADMSIVAGRKLLLRGIRAVQEGKEPPGVIRDPAVNAVDPIFLKRNAPPTEEEYADLLVATGGRWVPAPAAT
jgi:phenylpropionate dioxygenase-like ring-hydroxylating dioxygenase large terminal subunit